VRALPILLAIVLGGCSVRGAVITDEELLEDGTWTERDALARQLLDLEAPPHLDGKYPVRRVPVRRKLVQEVRVGGTTIPLPRIGPFGYPLELGALEALLGLDYERRYQYVARVRAWVIVHRDRPATVLGDDPDWKMPDPETDPEVFRGLGRSLERGVEAVHEAAERAREARPAASP
jgi:hypothetical protein